MAFLAPLAVPLALAGTALKGFSDFQQSQYQSAVAKNNAKISVDNENRASYASQIEQMRSDREYAGQEATLTASQAASGLDVLGASQVASRATLAATRGEQALDIRNKGLFDVRNFQQNQANFLGEARAQKTAAWMGLASTAFDLGGQIASPAGQKFTKSLIGGTR